MKRVFFLLSLLLLTKAYPDAASENEAGNWQIVKNSAYFSTSAQFDCKVGEVDIGKVIRTGLFCPRYYYDLYDPQDNFQIRGVTRFFSWGFLTSWGMEIDLYEGDSDNYLGKIEGRFFTRARAKFLFYDAYGETTGIAYLNDRNPEFIIVAAYDEGKMLAELKGKVFGEVSSWQMKFLQEPLIIDEGLLKIFTAFVADYAADFLPPLREVHYYHRY
jgi:hypothetical protein